MGMPPYVPPTRPISTAMFWSNTYTFDPLYADATISQSANIAGGLNVAGSPLVRGTVLYGPAPNTPITSATLLTTATGAGAARCILAADIDTSGGQVTGLVYTQGKFLDTAMTFTAAGASSDCASLWDFGIYVLTVEQRSGILVPMMKLPTTGGPLPQMATAKQIAETTKEQVAAIKAQIEAFRPPGAAYAPPPGTEAAWAIAAFGESKPSAEQAAKLKAAEEAEDLAAKQEKALADLEAKQSKEMAALEKQQREERAAFLQKTQDAVAKAAAPPSNAEKPPNPKH